MAQENIGKVGIYAEGLCSALKEMGTLETPAVDKLVNLLLTFRGGEMPDINIDLDTNEMKIFKNTYVEVLRMFFGIQWKRMIVLHKCLTMQSSDLMNALNIDSLDPSKSKATLKEKLE